MADSSCSLQQSRRSFFYQLHVATALAVALALYIQLSEIPDVWKVDKVYVKLTSTGFCMGPRLSHIKYLNLYTGSPDRDIYYRKIMPVVQLGWLAPARQ